ncbi:hypothetical protein [uncultured Aquimarina sp.]|uniref:hypothetical protein n=1 Tax=uncultured Aquimarina sp. TaxID=575652 RepID=UPI00261F2C75|nr:hypothetical protein [uncultured Aquimarina sp.]
MTKITDQEYKSLIIDIAKSISPEIIKLKSNSWDAAETVAIYSKNIADEVVRAIEDPEYDSAKK